MLQLQNHAWIQFIGFKDLKDVELLQGLDKLASILKVI